jgi:hypothetical protein
MASDYPFGIFKLISISIGIIYSFFWFYGVCGYINIFIRSIEVYFSKKNLGVTSKQ